MDLPSVVIWGSRELHVWHSASQESRDFCPSLYQSQLCCELTDTCKLDQYTGNVLEFDELKMLLGELDNSARLLVFPTAATGLRRTLRLPKKPTPIDGTLLQALQEWNRQTLYRQNDAGRG